MPFGWIRCDYRGSKSYQGGTAGAEDERRRSAGNHEQARSQFAGSLFHWNGYTMSEEEKQPLDTAQSELGEAVTTGENPKGIYSQGIGDMSEDLDLDQKFYSQNQTDEASGGSAGAPQGDQSSNGAAEAAGGGQANEDTLEDLRRQVETLKAQLEASNNQSESFKTQSMRIAADFDNFRKRTMKEKEDLEQQVKCATLGELLPVVDNFERARAAIKPKTEAEMNIQKSYQSVYKQLVESLKRLGVSPMRPEGQEFDPNLHEAVMRQPTSEHPEGTVIEELVRGYYLGDRVLRHAMVKVAAPLEESGEGGTEEQTPSASE